MLQRVEDIAEENPVSEQELAAAVQSMSSSHMIPALWAMYRTYIRQVNLKKRTVWIHGRANSGKSFLADELSKIFISQPFADSESKYQAAQLQSPYET
jgi:ATP-dependent protease Clp ATPase subunit